MTFSWKKMTVEEFAGFEQLLGQRIVVVNGNYWTQLHHLFYRPLLPYQEFKPGSIMPPSLSLLGGFQHVVSHGEKANSNLNLLMFENAEAYTLNSLDYQRRRQVKLAAKQFSIRPIADKEEFKENAYPLYLSFHERTQYRYGSERTNRDYFSRWADAIFKISKLAVLGGYRNGKLGGVSLSLLIGETVYYAIFFCDTESLRSHLSSFMLHCLRENVAVSQCAKQIFVGLYKKEDGKGVDDFYLQRGCHLIRKPAVLRVNPVAAYLLKHFLPDRYAQLTGDIKDAQGRQDVGPLIADNESQEQNVPRQLKRNERTRNNNGGAHNNRPIANRQDDAGFGKVERNATTGYLLSEHNSLKG